MKRAILAALFASAALLIAATSASAFTVDGALDPGYGAPLVIEKLTRSVLKNRAIAVAAAAPSTV